MQGDCRDSRAFFAAQAPSTHSHRLSFGPHAPPRLGRPPAHRVPVSAGTGHMQLGNRLREPSKLLSSGDPTAFLSGPSTAL